MNVDIYIKERNGSREIRVPWLPEAIAYESGDVTVASYEIMNRGEVAVPTGTGLAAVSWKSIFPGANRTDTSMMRGSWMDPAEYHSILESWKDSGTGLSLMVIGYPINLDVVLQKYTATPGGGFGDLEYEIAFMEDRPITIGKTTVPKAATTKATTSTQTKRQPKNLTTYTVKKGDTLWGIAKRFADAGTKWPSLYEENKKVIESRAKKSGKGSSDHGHWIFPGTKITISKAHVAK